MLKIAVQEINTGIHEVNQKERVAEYWRALGQTSTGLETGQLPWITVFISWVVATSGNPHGLTLSPSTSHFWRAASAKGFTKPPDGGQPVPGDLIFRALNGAMAKAMRDGQNAPGGVGILYANTPEGMSVIAGNVRNAVNLVTWRIDDPALVGFVHLPDPPGPVASDPAKPSGEPPQ